MPRLVGDRSLGAPGTRRRSHEPEPQRVPREPLRIEPGRERRPLHDPGHGEPIGPPGADVSLPIDRAEERPARDPCRLETRAEHPHGELSGVAPKGIALANPVLSWCVSDLSREIVAPAGSFATDSTSRATSSLRRNAPTKPTRRIARSRIPTSVGGSVASIAFSSASVTGAFWRAGRPSSRRSPAVNRFTPGCWLQRRRGLWRFAHEAWYRRSTRSRLADEPAHVRTRSRPGEPPDVRPRVRIRRTNHFLRCERLRRVRCQNRPNRERA